METLIKNLRIYTILIQIKNNTYCIKTEKLLKVFNNDYNQMLDCFVLMIKKGFISFPYKCLFSESPYILFQRLKKIKPHIIRDIRFDLDIYNYTGFKRKINYKYKGHFYIVSSPSQSYFNIDVLSDLFVENVRIKVNVCNQLYSSFKDWKNIPTLIKILKKTFKEKYITPFTLRKMIYKVTKEVKNFRPTIIKGILNIVSKDLKGKKMLDIFASWGDRLLTAISLEMEYIGYEKNIKLKPGHTRIIKTFGNPTIHFVKYVSFEKSREPKNFFDIVFISPPFYNIEDYKNDFFEDYHTFDEFLVYSLFKYIFIAFNYLKINGKIILSIQDTQKIKICYKTNLFIDTMLKSVIYEGVIGMKTGNIIYPIWVWRKTKCPLNKPEKLKKLKYFKNNYPNLYFLIKKEEILTP